MVRSRIVHILPVVIGGLLFLAGSSGYAVDEGAPRRSKTSANEIRRIPTLNIRSMEFRAPVNISGEIRLRTDVDVTNVEIEINKYVHNISSGERSNKILSSMTVSTEVVEDFLLAEVKTPDRAEWEGTDIGARVDLEVLLPPGWVFRARSDHYDFDLSGPFQEVDITGKFGKIQVDGVTEIADLRTEYGLLSLADARGQVNVNNRYGPSVLTGITVSEKPLHVRSERGPVTLSGIDGPVDIRVDDAEITISEWTLVAGVSRVTTRESPIDIGFVKWGAPQLRIENRNDEVRISTPEVFSAVIRLEVSGEGGGHIRTRGIPVKATRLEHRNLEGIAGDGEGLLEVSIIGLGDIMLRGPRPRVHRKNQGQI